MNGDLHQDNALMDKLRAWLKAQGETRAPDWLNAGDFAAFNETLADGSRVQQLFLRLVDLDGMVAAANAKPLAARLRAADDDRVLPDRPNMVQYDRNARVETPLLPDKVQRALGRAIDADPTLVERFTAKPAQS